MPLLVEEILEERVHVWSDAALDKPSCKAPPRSVSLGAIVFDDKVDVRPAFTENIPDKDVHPKSQIYFFEALAILAVLETFPDKLRGRRVIFHVDNINAMSMLRRCEAPNPATHEVLRRIWARIETLKICPFFRYVRSLRNVGDWLTRHESNKAVKIMCLLRSLKPTMVISHPSILELVQELKRIGSSAFVLRSDNDAGTDDL